MWTRSFALHTINFPQRIPFPRTRYPDFFPRLNFQNNVFFTAAHTYGPSTYSLLLLLTSTGCWVQTLPLSLTSTAFQNEYWHALTREDVNGINTIHCTILFSYNYVTAFPIDTWFSITHYIHVCRGQSENRRHMAAMFWRHIWYWKKIPFVFTNVFPTSAN